MILLTAAKMPEGLDKNTLAGLAEALFPADENREYLNDIKSRTDTRAALESLFALSLLYEQIRSLPTTDTDTRDLVLARAKNGKPYFINSEIKFNISHSKGYVTCATAFGEEVGVDIEASEIPPERAEKLAKRFFSEKEADIVRKNPKIFQKLWSEKEAKAKFSGESVGNILSQDKNNANSEDFCNIIAHSFAYGEIPITLCTKRGYSTISFAVQ